MLLGHIHRAAVAIRGAAEGRIATELVASAVHGDRGPACIEVVALTLTNHGHDTLENDLLRGEGCPAAPTQVVAVLSKWRRSRERFPHGSTVVAHGPYITSCAGSDTGSVNNLSNTALDGRIERFNGTSWADVGGAGMSAISQPPRYTPIRPL